MSILEGKKVIHFIGCGGSGMFPIIQILHGKGYTITGSDVTGGHLWITLQLSTLSTDISTGRKNQQEGKIVVENGRFSTFSTGFSTGLFHNSPGL